jgi:predicted lipid-binding transport protein (Tim44 family)
MKATAGSGAVIDTVATRPLHLSAELLDVRTTAGRRWISICLGALGILILAALVAAVVTMSHESSHPARHGRPAAPATASTVSVNTTVAVPAPPAAQPPTSWSVPATASTLATPPPPPAAKKPEPSVRQRLHDMFPRLIPVH